VIHVDAAPWAGGSPPRLLSSPMERGLYALAWVVFTVGFAAVFYLQSRSVALTALVSAARVVFPAALLGVGVVRLSERIQLGRTGAVLHAVACLAFPALWIGAVNVTNNAITYVVTGTMRWQLPPEHVIHWHYLAGVMIYVALAALTYGRARVFRAEKQRLWAEWKALRGQLNPHFLFNTLHTVFGLAQLEPAASEAAMTRFSRVLRYTLSVHREDRDLVSLREEWSFTEDYLHLEALRLDGRLTWRGDIASDLGDVAVPSLLIQPIVENAVRHSGVLDRDGVVITVAAHRTDDNLYLRIADNGRGTTVNDALGSTGVGLRAARTRVQRLDAASGAFCVETEPGAGFTVTMRLPILCSDVHPSTTLSAPA
jgi:LytS/YehU family sensor histidine kinase